MTPEDLAKTLDGSEYPLSTSRTIKVAAKAAGLVIVHGSSDDLMEFDGAIEEEIGAYEGATVIVDRQGLQEDFEALISDRSFDLKDKLRDYFKREGAGTEIEAVWDQEGYSWSYRTDIPHETFEIVEEGEKYCRGIVFALADVPEIAAHSPQPEETT